MFGKSIIDHNIRIKLGITIQQYVFIDCIHSFTTKKKFILNWKDIEICIGFSEEEITQCFLSLKDSGLLEVKDGKKIRSTDAWGGLFVEVDTVEETIRYLNIKANTSFKSTSKPTTEHLKARQREGYTLEDFKLVIDDKVEEWINDSAMCQYLRPITLFAPKKYESYLMAAKAKVKDKTNKLVM